MIGLARWMAKNRRLAMVLLSFLIFPGILPMIKFVYYNNLADICEILGKKEEANIGVQKCCNYTWI